MGISATDNRFSINGVIDTQKPVLENLTELCNHSGCWMTYDYELGKWGIVINQPGTSTRSFTDSNIVGTIEVSGIDLRDLYTGVRAQYANRDIRGEKDWISIDVNPADLNPGEIENILEIEYPLVDDPVQAELLAFRELKQSRINRSIRFRTDWSETGVKAGDIIDITNTDYGFTGALFRVISITEVLDDTGGLILDILAMGYDASVYDEDFTSYVRTNQDGIVTIGAIGTPATPQITKFETDVQPRLLYEAAAPTGLVEEMEFWVSTDGTDYQLVATVPPINGGIYSTNEEIEYTDLNVPGGDVYVKVRGRNSSTVGPFSAAASALFAPQQVTDVIGPNTVAQDGLGNILTVLAITELLSNLDKLLDLGDTSAGGIFDKIFDVLFGENGGVDVRDPGVMVPLEKLTTSQVQVSATAGRYVASGLAQTTGAGAVMHTVDFTAPIAGTYMINAIIDQNTSGARGGRGEFSPHWDEPEDNIVVGFSLYWDADGYVTPILSSFSGGVGAFSWTDFVVSSTVSLTTTDNYRIRFIYLQQTESNPTATASFDINWNVFTIDTSTP